MKRMIDMRGFARSTMEAFTALVLLWLWASAAFAETRPNILFILTDDHRHDCLSSADNSIARTPNLDRIADRGTRFTNAFATLAICSPSRAACLTGQYGSVNGVTSFGKVSLRDPQQAFAHALLETGYATGVTGKWHLKTTPREAGFQFASVCWSNGTWYNRRFDINREQQVMPGFVDDVAVDESLRFIRQATDARKPFMLWLNTQVPHMDHRHKWPARDEFLQKYAVEKMPLPTTWNDDLSGKPEYLKTSRSRTRALEYGYDDPSAIRSHARDYYASVEQMDRAIGRLLNHLEEIGLRDNTWIIFMGDNGWFLGEHGFTSKVLAYEESMRVPMVISPPESRRSKCEALVLNIDLAATILDIAKKPIPATMQGRSLLPLLDGEAPSDWRRSFLYEAPTSQLGSRPLWAVRDHDWKYVETKLDDGTTYAELYDLQKDAVEAENVATDPRNTDILNRLKMDLAKKREMLNKSIDRANQTLQTAIQLPDSAPQIPAQPPNQPRTDLFISGVYPHLTTYGVYSQNGAHYKKGHNECGIGAIVPWAEKLWMVNYAPHMPKGSEHKLYSVDPDLSKPLTVHPESVGGTPAGRMIHTESSQLLIAHHLIDAEGNVRTIQPADMPIRVTAIARHLKDPANKVYYIDMEGSIWEANVHTLQVKRLFKKPVPGWHSKGGYTSQGRLVISNNGELHVGNYDDVLVGGEAKNNEERGVLAEWDGNQWRIVERRQFTEVTGPPGIAGGSDGGDPIWSMGWDRRSVRFKLLENGEWHTYLLPKAAYCNDASHGWYTEWPRIREITNGRWMMDMHGMFFDFPKTFSVADSQGLRPIGSHLRYIPDFCDWNGKLVLATDETSIQGNHLAGQPQSNLWFGRYEDLQTWGPASGYGGPWVDDEVKAGEWSDPFLINGFQHRCLHLAVGRTKPLTETALRTTDQQQITSIPEALAKLPRVTISRGDWHQAAPGFSFRVDQPVRVLLAVDRRGRPRLSEAWKPTELVVRWGKGHRDQVYARDYSPGEIAIPPNRTEHTTGSFGMPHMAFIRSLGDKVRVSPNGSATVTVPPELIAEPDGKPVTFEAQIDINGTNQWSDFRSFTVNPNEASSIVLPSDLDAAWIRFRTSRDSVATAMLHQTSEYPNKIIRPVIFDGLADVDDRKALGARVYAAKRNRNLRIVTSEDRCYEFTKDRFEFQADASDESLSKLLRVDPEFTTDEASVIVESQGHRYRLPKGDSTYDKPFPSGWPRALREVESERTIANIHGTFYEVPLITNGAPPAWNLIRPISSHGKQITDYCSWNGLLVLSGVRHDASDDGHVFRDPKLAMGLWFGGVDDLWKFGKPVGYGGPWKNATVRAGVPSDAYLMTGYDQKSVSLSHTSREPVTIRLQIDVDGRGRWVEYESFKCPIGKTLSHDFPDGFSACWIRAVSDRNTTATVQLKYQ